MAQLKYHTIVLDDGAELVRYCKSNPVDIIIADIEMPVMSGFDAIEAIQRIRPDQTVIFVTSHDEFACQAYDYQPFWFVRKSEINKLEHVLDRCIRMLMHKRTLTDICNIKLPDAVIALDCRDIMYIENDRNYVKACADSGQDIRFRSSMDAVYQQLKEYGFIKLQRSYLVNPRYIYRLGAKKAVLKNGTEILLTKDKDKKNEIRSEYRRFMREQRW